MTEKRPWYRQWEAPKPQEIALIVIRVIIIVVEVLINAGR